MSRRTLEAAQRYLNRGFAVVPLPAGEKAPRIAGWQELRLTPEDLPRYFANGSNVGLLLGEASGGLVDIDLDAGESVKVAGRFLSPTLTSGRERRKHSHWWYLAPGAESRDWKAPDGAKLVELRSTGRQTVAPPSTHPSGERYVWHGGELAEVGAQELHRRCRELATAALIARHVPAHRAEGGGGRHEYALALAGFLLRPGRFDAELVEKLLIAAWDAAGYPDERSRREAHGDIRRIISDTSRRITAGDPAVGGRTLEEMAPGIVRCLRSWWGWNRAEEQQQTGPDAGEEKKSTQAELLVRCAAGAELFHTPAGDAYATVPVGDHHQTHPVRSRGFRQFLLKRFYDECRKPPNAQALQDALGVIEARSMFEGAEHQAHVRVAEHAGAIYIDLANDHWEVVEVTTAGWRIIPGHEAPVKFQRPRGMLALPTPVRGGDIGELRQFVNAGDEDTLRLIISWLIAALRPCGPYPVLILEGEQGSAKSTTARLLRALVDPSAAPLRGMPRNEHDLHVSARNSHVLAFDNVSGLKPWLSDALCSLATGGGFATRTLYTDAEETIFEGCRPVVLTGIADIADRPDLLDRALLVTLPRIPEEKRRTEDQLWRAFEAARPALLGALLDAVSGALVSLPSLRLEALPRMADFAHWTTAAERTLGWEPGTFMAAYTGNRESVTQDALDADPVGGAVRTFMAAQDEDEWTGTTTELWQQLGELVGEDIRHSRAWPGAPRVLSSRLRRIAPALRDVGIEYIENHDSRRTKTLRKNMTAKLRHLRHSVTADEKPLQNGTFSSDASSDANGASDATAPAEEPRKTPANPQVCDASDASDANLRPYSKSTGDAVRALLSDPPSWLARQMAVCREAGNPKRLLRSLAAAVASELVHNPRRADEVLPSVEAFMTHDISCGCEECT